MELHGSGGNRGSRPLRRWWGDFPVSLDAEIGFSSREMSNRSSNPGDLMNHFTNVYYLSPAFKSTLQY